MPASAVNTKIHLDSLVVSGFRGIPHLEMPRLGRVTLLAGKNGVGKTSVLEAVRVYAARSSYGVLATVLRNHAELHRTTNAEGVEALAPDWSGLFHGRDMWAESGIKIGKVSHGRLLTIRAIWAEDQQMTLHSELQGNPFPVFQVEFGFQQWRILIDNPLPGALRHRFRGNPSELPGEIGCVMLGPGLPGDLALARFWDEVLLKGEQKLAIDALDLVLGSKTEWIAAVGDTAQRGADRGRRVIVKNESQNAPVPLQSLGDGATRIFGAALALINSQGGFLLLDESENGIHHSVQRDFWTMVLNAAQMYNVQVLATTHSWDCVVGFAKAMQSFGDDDGVYIRLEKGNDGMRAVEYSREHLMAAAKYGFETR